MQAWVRGGAQMSVLEAALQLGIIELVNVPRRNARGQVVPGEAFAFFHDQYTQYWLAAALQAQVLGWLDEECLRDAASLSARVQGMASIVARSVQAPVLLGALDHWLNMNLQLFHAGRVEPLLPLFNALAAHESTALRHYWLRRWPICCNAPSSHRKRCSPRCSVRALSRYGASRSIFLSSTGISCRRPHCAPISRAPIRVVTPNRLTGWPISLPAT